MGFSTQNLERLGILGTKLAHLAEFAKKNVLQSTVCIGFSWFLYFYSDRLALAPTFVRSDSSGARASRPRTFGVQDSSAPDGV